MHVWVIVCYSGALKLLLTMKFPGLVRLETIVHVLNRTWNMERLIEMRNEIILTKKCCLLNITFEGHLI